MDFQKMCHLLPTERDTPYEVEDYAREMWEENCYCYYLGVYKRVPITVLPQIGYLVSHDEFAIAVKNGGKHWGAEMTCGVCGESFIGGWIPGVKGVRFFQGETGDIYEGYCGADERRENFIEIGEGDIMICPRCGCPIRATHISSIRHGITERVQVTKVTNIGKYTAVISWIAESHTDEYNSNLIFCYPREAIVIDDNGKLERFSRVSRGMYGERKLDNWRHIKTYDDPMQARFYSHSDGWCKGSEVIPIDKGENFYGETAEKTGLAEYLSQGGSYPNVYLKTWQKYPQIENLMKSDLGNIISGAIYTAVSQSFRYNLGSVKAVDLSSDDVLNLKESKPHKILGISKSECKVAASLKYGYSDFKRYKDFNSLVPIEIADYEKLCKVFSYSGINAMLSMIEKGFDDFKNTVKISNYINKVKGTRSNYDALELYCDYRRILKDVNCDTSSEMLYPKDLESAHDEITSRAAFLNRGATGDFQKIIDEYAPLEWNDGELCIRLPRSAIEIIKEGETLRHCVGGYVNTHTSGECTVFFVRHYRRPERSYYTLDISLKKGMPVINQLHGYGNEHHGEHKEHSHTIPNSVKAFVERWEKEILNPFFIKRQIEKSKEFSKSA